MDIFLLNKRHCTSDQLASSEIRGIVLLISRPLLTHELNHVVSEANQLLDCVGLEIGDNSIRFFEDVCSLQTLWDPM